MRIVIVGHFVYPTGSASASRVRHLAIGLRELGHEVFVLPLAMLWAEAAGPARIAWHRREDVAFYPAGGFVDSAAPRRSIRGLSRLARSLWLSQNVAVGQIGRLHRRGKVGAVIGYGMSHVGLAGVVNWCRRGGVAMAWDVVEWAGPESFSGGRFSPLFWDSELSVRRSLLQVDGVIAISSYLERLYEAKGKPVLRVPALIDSLAPGGGETGPTDRGQPFGVTYLGTLTQRDGPMLMLDAVRKIAAQGIAVRFDIVGTDGRRSPAREARQRAEGDPLLAPVVRFWGRLSDAEVRERLNAADALVFTRLSGRPAEAAFPTRLPEYLMTGKPVISSAVGDIPEYLVDGRDAILVAPDSPEALAGGIARLLRLPDRGRQIGLAGRVRCGQCFDYRRHCRAVSDFLAELAAAKARGR